MLEKLTIENYALIGRLEIELPKGLTILTGETGAGKSILLGALSLILGAKADASVIRDRSRNCIVEADFSIDDQVRAFIEEQGFSADGNRLCLRRVVNPTGRSRSFLNDEPVGVKVLTGISSLIIDIHGQHQHLLLADRAYQRRLLDLFAGISSEVEEYHAVYRDYIESQSQLADLEKRLGEIKAEAEYKEFRLQQIRDLNLQEGELEELEEEHNTLAHAEDIKTALFSIMDRFSPEGQLSLSQSIKDIINSLSKLSGYSAVYSGMTDRLESCKMELDDIESDIERLSGTVEFSPERLEAVEQRISDVNDVFRKFSVSSAEELKSEQEKLENETVLLGDLESRIEELRKKITVLLQSLTEKAKLLHVKRTGAASSLAGELVAIIRELGMSKSEMKISVEKQEVPGPYGMDEVVILFSANGDQVLNELSKVASGGELSRIALSIKAMMAKYTGMPTMIFDEIDTGVSGSVADKMGGLIDQMGQQMQLLVITHLPQIASKGSSHFVVFKQGNETGKVETFIRKISDEERVYELAKMLSGSNVGEAALANAKELLKK